MITIGLTGGIACGKSSVATILRTQGLPVLDADQVARDVVAAGQPALLEIQRAFGHSVLQADGTLNRPAMRELMLSDPKVKGTLEAITHPKIGAKILRWILQQRSNGQSAAVVEAALMVETGTYKQYDALIVVACERTVQIQRLMQRNELSQAQAVRWIDSQLPLADKVRLADWKLDNTGPLMETTEVVVTHLPTFLAQCRARQTL